MQRMITVGVAWGLAVAGWGLLQPCAGRAAEPWGVGAKVTPFTAKDQHEQDFKLEPGCRFLLVSFDMSTGKKANKQLAELGKSYLPERKAVYMANIHGMPGIGRLFALPKMRKYPHRIVLADQKGLLDSYPQKPDQVTILTLDEQLVIKEVRYWDPEKTELKTLLPQSGG